jgi:hypothetical protein
MSYKLLTNFAILCYNILISSKGKYYGNDEYITDFDNAPVG